MYNHEHIHHCNYLYRLSNSHLHTNQNNVLDSLGRIFRHKSLYTHFHNFPDIPYRLLYILLCKMYISQYNSLGNTEVYALKLLK